MEREQAIKSSVIYGHYEQLIDRESAYEKLKGRADTKQPDTTVTRTTEPARQAPTQVEEQGALSEILFGRTGPRGGKQTKGVVESVASSAARAIGSELGRQVLRGVLGSILGGGKRR